jgi:hypothetical protein
LLVLSGLGYNLVLGFITGWVGRGHDGPDDIIPVPLNERASGLQSFERTVSKITVILIKCLEA